MGLRAAGRAVAGLAVWLALGMHGPASTTGAEQIFRGEIARCQCAAGAGAACSVPCAGKGGYTLSDAAANRTYQLNDKKAAVPYGARDVIIVGFLEQAGSTIHVDDIVRDVPEQVRQAKTVAIVCDACPRSMAKARKTALLQLMEWNHFTLVDDPHQADLIFLFSANPYLGDYVTRDGPDKRPVALDTVYLNLIDPRSGANLWGDYRQQGWLLISNSTRELVTEVRQILEMDKNPYQRQLFVEQHLVPRLPPTASTSPGK